MQEMKVEGGSGPSQNRLLALGKALRRWFTNIFRNPESFLKFHLRSEHFGMALGGWVYQFASVDRATARHTGDSAGLGFKLIHCQVEGMMEERLGATRMAGRT